MRIHPLLDHMTDVACVLEAMLSTVGLRRAAERAAERPLSRTDIARLCVLAFLHDIGKANAGFQGRYWRTTAERPVGWHAQNCGHGPQGWGVLIGTFATADRIKACLPVAEIASWGDGCETLLHASISHHGRPVADDCTESIWERVVVGGRVLYDPADAIAAMGLSIRSQFPLAFEPETSQLPTTPAFTHHFAGLVQLADWLGSDTREGFFPYSLPGEDRSHTAKQRARRAVSTIGLDVGDPDERRRVTHFDFGLAFHVAKPRPMQTALATAGLGPVLILEAETGSGKTEAALWRFLHLWRAGHVDALYFALPTRVAATQLHERVRKFVDRVWSSDAPVVVRALPGYTAADGQGYEALPGFEVLWHDTPADDEAERRWAAESPKRYLAATIAVGTVDQALLGTLQIKHSNLRQAALSRSLLVMDEVHASDAYMTRLSEHLLRAHVSCGGHALLLSATLGAVARTRYLSIGAQRAAPMPSLAEARAMPYPAIGSCDKAGPYLESVVGNPRGKTVHWETLDLIDDVERIAALALNAAAEGARVLVVRNTVAAAIATLRAVEALPAARALDCLFRVAGVSTLHHSRFSRQDRPLLDAEVQTQLGRHRTQSGGRVVIGTQTLEQSLDIDADLLITDLCPMDVLLQRLGRLHRHERPSAEAPDDHRPEGFGLARALVLTPLGNNLGALLNRQRHGLGPIRIKGQPLAGVYVDLRVLEATRRLIAGAPTRSIPADNRMLVELTTHPAALDAVAREMGPDWVTFGHEVDGGLAANKTIATMHALPFDQPFGESLFPQNEHMIGSRLGAADRLVTFEDLAPVGPFGLPVVQIALRHHMVPRALAADTRPEAVRPLPCEGGFTFRLGEAEYRYSRWGVERLSSD